MLTFCYVSPLSQILPWDIHLLCTFKNFGIGAVSAFSDIWCLNFKDLLPCLVCGVDVNDMVVRSL